MAAPARPKSAAGSPPSRAAAAAAQAESTIAPRSAPLAGFAGTRRVPPPVNEPVKSYAPRSPERAEIKARLKSMAGERIQIPLVIGGRDVHTGETAPSVMPHD